MRRQVLDKGFVKLDGYMADDLSVINAARVSFANQTQITSTIGSKQLPINEVNVPDGQAILWEQIDDRGDPTGKTHLYLNSKDKGLINFLMRERHGTPFEHNSMRFHVKAPLFVVREWQRHRIASYNEWSGRYSIIEPEFYMPALQDVRTQVGKPGSYEFEPMEFEDAHWTQVRLEKMYKSAYNHYESMLERGVAKEVARLVLPLATYTQFYFTVNARSLMNFLSLRNSDQAMYEIREYAIVLEQLWKDLMPVTHQAFINNERTAP